MSDILSIDKIIYGVEDRDLGRRFFGDWGLNKLEHSQQRTVFETLEGSQIVLHDVDDQTLPSAVETGSTVRQLVWAVRDEAALARLEKSLAAAGHAVVRTGDMLTCNDPIGLSLGFRVAARRKVTARGAATNAYGRITRKDEASPIYHSAQPARLSHAVFFTDVFEEHLAFYTEHLGFHVSDSYPGEGVFLRCQAEGGHHDLFLLSSPVKPRGLNHVSFMVRDIYEVFGGGIHMNKQGWKTEIGPGRHPVSSAMFWYVQCPCGALVEYYADEDHLSEQWQPREFERSPENFAEWSVLGGIDANTRKQVGGRGKK